MNKPQLKPVRTYEVTVARYGAALYSARSRSKAVYAAFLVFRRAFDGMQFVAFMKMARASLIKDPPGCGDRIVVETTPGRPETVTRCYGPTTQYVYFMRDDADHVVSCHPLDVRDQGRRAA